MTLPLNSRGLIALRFPFSCRLVTDCPIEDRCPRSLSLFKVVPAKPMSVTVFSECFGCECRRQSQPA